MLKGGVGGGGYDCPGRTLRNSALLYPSESAVVKSSNLGDQNHHHKNDRVLD